MDLWTPTSVETRLFISSCKYKGVWIYLLIFILKNAIGKQLLPGRVQNCYPNVLFPACAQPRTLCGWKPEWDERTGHNPLSKRWGVPFPQAGHWGSGELSKKAAGVRQMSYPMSGAIFTADAGVRLLWGHLTKKGAGSCRFHSLLYPCQCIRTFDSKPSSWITELTFVEVIFQLELRIFTDVLRMTVPFRSNLYFLVPKQNEKKKFKCFGKTIVISECPFSTSLVEEGCC